MLRTGELDWISERIVACADLRDAAGREQSALGFRASRYRYYRFICPEWESLEAGQLLALPVERFHTSYRRASTSA